MQSVLGDTTHISLEGAWDTRCPAIQNYHKKWRKNSCPYKTFHLTSHSCKMGWGDYLNYFNPKLICILHISTVFAPLSFIQNFAGKANCAVNLQIIGLCPLKIYQKQITSWIERMPLFEAIIPNCTGLYLS